MAEPISLHVDIISDVICPWCYIGMKRLEDAKAQLGDDIKLDVHWRPYQLDGTIAPTGKDRRKYLEDKFGGPEGAAQVYGRIKDAGKADGIDFQFDKIALTPNTIDAHLVLHWAGQYADQHADQLGSDAQNVLAKRLFIAYFEQGADFTSHEVLADHAAAVGLDRDTVLADLKSGKDREQIKRDVQAASNAGISGVPCFVIEQQYAVQGAQPAEAMVEALRKVAEMKSNMTA